MACKIFLTAGCKKCLPGHVKNCLPWSEKTPYHVMANLPYHAQRIFNISSQAGIMGFNGGSAYCAAKFSVVGLSEALNNELNQFGIEVCAVAPGAFRTDFRDASSMHFLKKTMPEYDGTPAHTMIDWLKENNHKQMGDSEIAAGFLYKISEMETIPQILTIGKDCSDASLTHYKKIIEDLESYYDDSCKTAFEE